MSHWQPINEAPEDFQKGAARVGKMLTLGDDCMQLLWMGHRQRVLVQFDNPSGKPLCFFMLPDPSSRLSGATTESARVGEGE